MLLTLMRTVALDRPHRAMRKASAGSQQGRCHLVAEDRNFVSFRSKSQRNMILAPISSNAVHDDSRVLFVRHRFCPLVWYSPYAEMLSTRRTARIS